MITKNEILMPNGQWGELTDEENNEPKTKTEAVSIEAIKVVGEDVEKKEIMLHIYSTVREKE